MASNFALIIDPIQTIAVAPHSPSLFLLVRRALSLSLSRSRLRRPIFIISLLLSFAAGESRDSLPGVADAVSASLLAAAVTTSVVVVVVVVDRRTYRGVASFVPSAANERRTDGR